MPLATLHLLSLSSKVTRDTFLQRLLNDKNIEVIVASQPRYWVVRPSKSDVNYLSNTSWHLMVLLKSHDGEIPLQSRPEVVREYKVMVGVPSKLLANYEKTNKELLSSAASVPLTGALDSYSAPESSQNLELSPDLYEYMGELMQDHPGPVTMLNLLHFHPDGKSSYYEYGQVDANLFSPTYHTIHLLICHQYRTQSNTTQGFRKAGGKRGGNAKIVGNVVAPPSGQSDSRGDPARDPQSWWNEIAIVHYPTIKHFCDMAAGEDYQAINQKYRLPVCGDERGMGMKVC